MLVLTKFSFWEEDLGIRLQIHEVLTLSRSATGEATRIYQFITNNEASFHFWLKENLVKHQNFSKYYDHGCNKNLVEKKIELFP